MKIVISLAILLMVIAFITACGHEHEVNLKAGGIYSINRGDGDFGVAKVLVLDGKAIHIRLYKNRFTRRPATVDTNELSLGSIHDGEGNFGIGHLPIQTTEFLSWQPELIRTTVLKKEELMGYEMWKEESGGVLGK